MTEQLSPMAFRISAADLGSNTLKFTHAELGAGGDIIKLREAADTLRLGAGIEQTGRVEPARIDACLDVLVSEQAVGETLGSKTFIGVATEALRVATNGQELLDRIAAETSWKIRLVSGDEEARLTFVGLSNQVPPQGTAMIVDIGGGSTEVIRIADGEVASRKSIPLGSGRLADRYFHQDPPGLKPIMNATDAARPQIEEDEQPSQRIGTLLFSGGNGVFVKELIDQLFPGEPFSLQTVERLLQHLATAPAADTAERLGIAHERARVLPAGAAIAFGFLLREDAEHVLGVESGIRLGLIREYAGR